GVAVRGGKCWWRRWARLWQAPAGWLEPRGSEDASHSRRLLAWRATVDFIVATFVSCCTGPGWKRSSTGVEQQGASHDWSSRRVDVGLESSLQDRGCGSGAGGDRRRGERGSCASAERTAGRYAAATTGWGSAAASLSAAGLSATGLSATGLSATGLSAAGVSAAVRVAAD